MPHDLTQHQHQGDRALWAAVVQQAIDDLGAPPDSLERAEAISFFTSGGDWRQSRIDIADRLGVHADDLERCGRRLMGARGITESLVRPVQRVAEPPPAPPPRLVAMPTPARSARQPKPVKDRGWWIRQFLTERAA